jgi:hypothetical protein
MTISTQTFVAVNTGTVANDGLGDSLRQAFVKVNSNFSNISSSGFNAGNILAAGTVQAGYFLGDGSLLTNLPLAVTSYSNVNVKAYTESMGFANYGNANVASYVSTYVGTARASNVTVTGNVLAANVLAGNIIAGSINTSGNVYAQVVVSGALAYTNLLVKTPNYITVSNTWVYTLSSSISDNILLVTNPGGITATINMPVTAIDGQICRFSANSNVTLAAGSGTVQPPFAGGNVLTTTFQYIWRASASTWYKN